MQKRDKSDCGILYLPPREDKNALAGLAYFVAHFYPPGIYELPNTIKELKEKSNDTD